MIKEYKYHITGEERHDVSLFGAVPADGELEIVLRFIDERRILSVKMVIHSDGLSNKDGEVWREYEMSEVENSGCEFRLRLDLAKLANLSPNGLFYYRYDVASEDASFSLAGDEVTSLVSQEDFGDRQLLVYDKDFKTPEFIKGGMIYHIFVDRFATSGKYPVKEGAVKHKNWYGESPEYAEYRGAYIKNNDFFGGDLTGVLEKLDYIESLGVTTIYLSPVFDSPSNHKYDTSDYMTVDPMFGGDEALRDLVAECKRRGIGVILDGVFNHTGDDSVYFDRYHRHGDAGAYNNRNSPYFSWYNFTDYPEEYECWWGIKILPRVDSSNPDFMNYILGDGGVVEKYMRMGVSGFRLDVADELSEKFLAGLRKKVKREREDSIVLGEVWEDASNKIAYSERRSYLAGAELDSVMNYPLRGGIISFLKYGDHLTLKHALESIYRHYPKCVSDSLMNFLGTHDTERIITVLAGAPDDGKNHRELAEMRLSDEERARGRALVKCAWAIAASSYGTPSIFYGDEAGLEGYHDPFCRRPFPWGHEDTELLDFYRKIGRMRKNEELFRDGLFTVVHSDENSFVTCRSDGASKIYTVVTRDSNYAFSPLESVEVILDSGTEQIGNDLFVPPYTARVFKTL